MAIPGMNGINLLPLKTRKGFILGIACSLMGLRRIATTAGLVGLALGVATNARAELFDDFNSGKLDTTKWGVRQDVEGQPLMDEGVVTEETFHTQQNSIGDRRVYLFPKRQFTTGDTLEWDFDVRSRTGNYMVMALLTGGQYIRIGIMGYIDGVQGFDELGAGHARFEFQEGNLFIQRTAPSGLFLTDNLHLSNPNGTYSLYVGSVSGHNGMAHIDYDNFYMNGIVPEPATGAGVLLGGIALLKRRKTLA